MESMALEENRGTSEDLDLEKAALGVLCIGFRQDDQPEGDSGLGAIPSAAAALVKEGAAGAILFKRNIRSPGQTARLVKSLKDLAKDRPFILAVDQEGGRVARLKGNPYAEVPSMRRVGETEDEKLAFQVGMSLGKSLRMVGFDVDFAPVMDVDTNPQNPVIGDRSFGRDPMLVGRMGVALAKGLEAAGVASCAKHFPGHGDTCQDSHLTLPKLSHSMDRLRRVELLPFVQYAREGLACTMSAHVVFQAIDPTVPATFSRQIQTDLLRGEVGFSGLLVCDDLEMNAVADCFDSGEAAVLAIAAGVDLLLICHDQCRQRQAVRALVAKAKSDEKFRERLLEAAASVRKFAHKWCRKMSEGEVAALEKQEALGIDYPPFDAPELNRLNGQKNASVELKDPTEYGRG